MKSILALLSLSIVLAGCTSAPATLDQYSTNSQETMTNMNTNEELASVNECETVQTDMPETGEEIAVVTTNLGTFKMRFFPCDTPETVTNFKELAKRGFYEGVIFHRVIPNFMIQGGDPTGTGRGGESYKGSEPIVDEFSAALTHVYGAVSMANRGPNTGTSQFFIVNAKEGTPHLDGMHSVFAQVFEGLDTVEAISAAPTDVCQPYENRAGCDKPLEDVVIESISIEQY